jgi:type II secretory pathway predicted ATPase ExeA
MYSEHFGFEELPFSVTPDPRFFYDTAVYQDVLAGLRHGIDAKSAFIVVTGEAGTGKTTLLRRLIYDSPGTTDYAFVNIRPRLSLLALLRAILKELKVPSSSLDQQDLLEELGSYVLDRFTKGRTVAFLFDESQGLSDELLLELPVLWNVAIESEKLVPIVLMGQPELDKRLNSPKLRQLGQHITLRRQLMPFPDDEVGPYIATRLEHVGYRGDELFEPAAIERLINRSNGIPRLINSICDNALLRAYRASQYKVTAAMIDEIAYQLRLAPRSQRAKMPDEVVNLFRVIDHTASADQKRTDEAVNQPRFVESFLSADPKKTDEIANQPRFVDRPPTLDQEKIHEAADVPRFVDDEAPSVAQKKSDEIIHQPRFGDDIPHAEQKPLDEGIDPLRFVVHSASADQKTAPEMDQPQNLEKSFSAESLDPGNAVDDADREDKIQINSPKPPETFPTPFATVLVESTDAVDKRAIEDRDQLAPSGFGHPQNLKEPLSTEPIEASNKEPLSTEPIEASNPSDILAKDDRERLALSKVDQPPNVTTHFSISSAEAADTVGPFAGQVGDQPAPSEIDQPQKLEKSFSEFKPDKAVDDAAKKRSDPFIPPIYQRNYQLGKANRLRISIGASIILVVVAGALAVFYAWQRDAAVPGKRYVENLSRETSKPAVPAKPVDDVKNNVDVSDKKVVEEPPQAASVAPPPAPDVPEKKDQNRDPPKKPNLVEGGNVGKTTPASQDIYRVKGPSFLRKRPAANAEIIDTLHPGMRIVVTDRSGEYFSVQSSDGKVSGFVHKEDAFFERIGQ